ncbi:Mu transposase C-terminal domain-containing protein [Parvibaculum sp.]|uniref:Mu transposase C-terminal domain-containing protein n=1 Tax=Parvibaculum sp. TaxID=2024848 RepID=UPI00262A74CD|nr:Mu transposase C-terminal domain-containing protein [Parvibaculum sp.]MCW5728529.1 transposase [Parvibaculum sp.]
MSGRFLAPNDKVQFHGRYWVVAGVNNAGDTVFQSSDNGQYTTMTEVEIKTAYTSGELKPIAGGKTPKRQVTDILDISPKHQEEFQRRQDYLRLVQARISNPTRRELERNIKIIGALLGDPIPPSVGTFYRWKRAEDEARAMGACAVPGHARKGNHTNRVSPEVQEIIRRKLAKDYLSDRRLSLANVWKDIVAIVDEENAKRSEEERFPLPGIGAVRRALRRTFSPHEICIKREGRIAADRKFRIAGKSLAPDYPMQFVQIDHTVSDQIGLDEDLIAILGRLYVAAASDVYSGMIVGLQVGFVPPSTASLFSLIRNMILPKTYVQERWPEIQTVWECDGLASHLGVDRGNDLLSKPHIALGHEFQMEIGVCGARRPYQKGGIENFFGLLSRNFSRRIPGATFSNPVERGEYNSMKRACLAYTDIVRLLHQWVIEVHANQPRNEDESRTRRELWNEGLSKRPHIPPRPIADLGVFMAGRAQPTLNGKGVRINNQFYRSTELELLRRRIGDKKVRVRFDPADMGEAQVFDHQNDLWIPVYNVDPLHHGRSLYQLQLERRARLGTESAAERALRSAKHQVKFQQELDATIERSKGGGGKRQKMNARASGIGVQAHSNIGKFAMTKKSDLPTVHNRSKNADDCVDMREFRDDDAE